MQFFVAFRIIYLRTRWLTQQKRKSSISSLKYFRLSSIRALFALIHWFAIQISTEKPIHPSHLRLTHKMRTTLRYFTQWQEQQQPIYTLHRALPLQRQLQPRATGRQNDKQIILASIYMRNVLQMKISKEMSLPIFH